MNNEAPFIVLAVWGVVSGFGWIVWVLATNIRMAKVARTLGQMQTELVEKLGSSQELMGFLQTEAGQRLLAAPVQPEPKPSSFRRILNAVQAGIVLTVLGAALAMLSRVLPLAGDTFIAFGTIAGALGGGLLVSALASYWLSRSMGLMDRTSGRSDS
jgi:hypothetical protein